jgi:hypothetical protein
VKERERPSILHTFLLPLTFPPFTLSPSSLPLEGSVEQHRYTGTLSKEKKAFESLIDTKEHMVISLPDHSEDLLRWGAEKMGGGFVQIMLRLS